MYGPIGTKTLTLAVTAAYDNETWTKPAAMQDRSPMYPRDASLGLDHV